VTDKDSGSCPIVYVVDDRESDRLLLEEMLAGDGYQLVFAASGEEALAKTLKLTPDLILLDVMMPGMDGFQVCRLLRDSAELAEVPVIMVTALDDRESRLKGIEAGADDFVSKPYDLVELRARVRSVTRLNRFRRMLQERERFEWVATSAEDGYLVVNAEDEILFANPRAARLLDLPDGRVRPSGLRFLRTARSLYRCVPESAWLDWPGDWGERFLLSPETAEAAARWLRVTVLSQATGAGKAFLVCLRDVTQEVAAARERRAFQRMVQHKLSTPLAGILTCAQTLAGVDDIDRQELVTLGRLLTSAAERLQRDVNSVLALLDAPTVARSGPAFDLAGLSPLVAELASEVGLVGTRCLGIADVGGVEVDLTEEAMEWALRELFENAVKFHPTGTPDVVVEVERPGHDLVNIRVRDDGVSLTPEQLKRAWVPYVQGGERFTGEVAGMGLGLTTVATLVGEVGGTCELSNRPEGRGVVVELSLPARVREPRPEE